MPDNIKETLEEPVAAEPAQTAFNADTDAIDETLVQTDAPAKTPRKKPEAADGIPDHFGRYRIEKLLGQGAMGAVYLAHDSQLDRKVALKVPQFSGNAPADLIERFYREARSAATLTHPNICPVYDVGEHDGRHFISMGFIDGRPLSDYAESGKAQPERQVAGIIRKLAQALQEAHDKGIIHRDLKPANIMIDRRKEPIVMDFGLARQADDQGDAKLTRDGTLLGSPSYMSPEQVQAGKLGPATDIYSLGVVLYELLTGRTPYEGNVTAVIGQIVTTEATPPIELRPDITPGISAICTKAMAKQPDERFGSMKEFAAAIGALLKGDVAAVEANIGLSVGDDRDTIVQKLKKQKTHATTLIEAGQFKSAVAALQELAEQADGSDVGIVEWAKKQLPQAQEKYDNSAEECRSLYRRAKKSFESGDYDRTLSLLEQIPEDMENRGVLDLRAEARDLSDEAQSLSEEVSSAARSGEYNGLMPKVDRLLELKPNHRQANELYDKLYSAETAAPEPKPRPRKRRKKSSPVPVPAIVGGACAVLAAIACLVIFFGPGDEEETAPSKPPPGLVATTVPSDDLPPTDPVPPETQPGDGGLSQLTPESFLARHDSNNDGQLDSNEVPPLLMKRLDRNKDGILTLDDLKKRERDGQSDGDQPGDSELAAQPEPPPDGDRPPPPPSDDGPQGPGPKGGPPGKFPEMIERLFRHLDRNQDERLSAQELPPNRPIMERADTDFDNFVTLEELREMVREYGRDSLPPPPPRDGKPPRDGGGFEGGKPPGPGGGRPGRPRPGFPGPK